MSDGLELPNLDAFIGQLEQWAAERREVARQAAIGLAYHALVFITEHSAQFSGDFAANWNVAIVPNPAFRARLFDITRDRIMGDPEAVNWALANNRGALTGFRLGDTIHLTNNAEHDEPYAWRIEDNAIRFRDGNEGEPLQLWEAVAAIEFRHLDWRQAEALAAHPGDLA